MELSSSIGAALISSPIASALGDRDVQQLEVPSSRGVTMPAPMNPLLLASACFGSLGALNFLFSREDAQKPPLIMPTQEFLDLLTPVSSTRKRLTVPQASGDVEDGVDQSCLPSAAKLLKGVTAEGDTALHVVASHGHGDSIEFQNCARIINERDQGLLFAVNRKGDTPLHCAARAGKSRMLSCLIELAQSCNRLHELVRKENVLKETALHDAVRIGSNDIVELLLEADPELTNYPKEGTSPLYLAISLERNIIAKTLYKKSGGNLSYHGPYGQNALHAAILRGTALTEDLLEWNNILTIHGDRDGSTPLHFASSLHSRPGAEPLQNRTIIRGLWHSNIFEKVFESNLAPVYQADNKGLFPIHVAASLGVKGTIRTILKKCPSSAGLRNAKGGTFLHVAVENKRWQIVSYVCQTPTLSWILNMQDNDGNTALHLAVKAGMIRMFFQLYGNKEVHLSLTNRNGGTPLDLSRSLLRPGMHYAQNSDKIIHKALTLAHAKHSGHRWDQIYEKYSRPFKPEDKIKEAEKMKDSSQILGIGSVLIATVAFGATFAVPGGFIADDHTNRGTPTFAGRYTFDAFMMANALAFICSSIATIGLMYSGSPMVDLGIRQINFAVSVFFMASSVTSLSAAFALAVYMVLAPVTRTTAIAVCAFSPLIVLSRNLESLAKFAILARPLCVRIGLRALLMLANMIFSRMLWELWPFIIIFGWAAIAQKLQNH
ncbi:hypothetical protein CFC21_004940 [Triticum aestivum]|uniref:PGG domain-containing protein n=2 Tax=Triticum aestivum TaxID=4565 RepID=A0A3B5YQU6_WHEAT|nr:hypothetical protein CFC21_004940 [Triticum aestivum]